MLAHPARRVRIFHPRHLYEAFPAGLVICCKVFVSYGDCACRYLPPTQRKEFNLDMFFHPPDHIRAYLRRKMLCSTESDIELQVRSDGRTGTRSGCYFSEAGSSRAAKCGIGRGCLSAK